MNNAIEIRRLRKSYGNNTVLKDINFHVVRGEVFALLGVNGAGKTTTLECIEGLLKYEGGSIKVNGTRGIQLQSSSLPGNIRPMEALQLFARWNKAKVDSSMVSTLGIDDLKNKKYMDMSMGQKRRLHLALAMTGNPDIIFLDEPTAGLDVEGRISLHNEIRRLKNRGKTIVLASHDMAEVESLCDRIAILNKGTIVFTGTVDELTDKLGKQYHIIINTDKGDYNFQWSNIGESMLSVLKEFKEKNINVLDIKINRGSLEQHFITMAKEAF